MNGNLPGRCDANAHIKPLHLLNADRDVIADGQPFAYTSD
jgi:hypothetical protein